MPVFSPIIELSLTRLPTGMVELYPRAVVALSFNSNTLSLVAQRRLSESSQELSRTFERLSSGLRINRASDDAAGLAISSQLSASSRIFSQAIRNANDGISALNIVDGALGELGNVLTRLNELAAQAANGSLSLAQRRALDTEAQKLSSEFNRQVSTTKFNGLGLLDLTSRNFDFQLGSGTSNVISAALGQQLARSVNSGSFASGSTPTLAGSLGSWAVGDFNNDGISDIVASQDLTSAGTYVFYGSSSGTFSSGTLVGDDSTTSSVSAADLNGDGNLDVLYYDTDVSGYVARYGDGKGGFATAKNVLTSAAFGNLKVVDVTGDGKAEILGYSGSTLSVYGSNDAGSYSLKSSQTLSSLVGFEVTDINGDGKLDLTLASATSVAVSLGAGDGAFGSQITTAVSGLANFATGDLNHDGLADLVINKNGSTTTQFGNGDGTFQTAVSYATAGTSRGVSLADVDGDGEIDIIARNGISAARLLTNNGDGTFAVTTSSLAFGTTDITMVGDFNGDSVVDYLSGQAGIGFATYIANTQQSTGIQRFNLTTQSAARSTLTTIAQALTRVQSEQASVGAAQSRLGTAISTLQASREAYKSAESRITDVDVATETARLARNQILQQASSAVLAQSNQQNRIALSLLTS